MNVHDGSPDNIAQIARDMFGIHFLTPWQQLVIAHILDVAGEPDTELNPHQIVLLPTGSGKSLCFLAPAPLLAGATLIVYPLLALMADQKRRLDERGIPNVILQGRQTTEERNECFANIRGGVTFILANPEILLVPDVQEQLARCRISHVAIDEAHCISEWGDSFRPAYLKLGTVIARLHPQIVTAFTATASPAIIHRIADVLFDGEAHIVRGECDRPNIHYAVIPCYAKKRMAFQLAIESPKPLLMFCGTRKNAEDMARELATFYGSDIVRFYHAGLERHEKKAVESWFFPRTDAILCCTCAFGMGVDKPDIRTVIHYDVRTTTIPAYIQEAGRAGRDALPAHAYLLWSAEDARKRSHPLYAMAEGAGCRRQALVSALGGGPVLCEGCDVCDRGTAAPGAEDAEFALRFIASHRKCYTKAEGAGRLTALFNRRDSKRYTVHVWSHKDVMEILKQLEESGRIKTCRFPWKDRVTITRPTLPRREPHRQIQRLRVLALAWERRAHGSFSVAWRAFCDTKRHIWRWTQKQS